MMTHDDNNDFHHSSSCTIFSKCSTVQQWAAVLYGSSGVSCTDPPPTRQSFKKLCFFRYVHLVVPSPLCNYSYAGVSFEQEI